MSNEDWLMSNEKSHYESLKLQDVLNKRLIKELQTELKSLKQVKNHVVLDNVSGSLPNLVDLSNAVEDAINVADSGTTNWYTELQNQLLKDGYAIIKLNDR